MTNFTRVMGTVAAAAIIAAAAPAAAATFNWTGSSDFDNGEFTTIAPTFANTISFYNVSYFPGNSVYNSAGAHSHGQPVNFTINATIDGVQTDIYTQLLEFDAEQLLGGLGTITFAGGTVTTIGFGCDNCSFNTFHGFGGLGDTTFTLGNVAGVPEAATWAMLISGFGLVGAAARRRRAVAA